MSIFRKPKGNYTRGTGDWFQSETATASGWIRHTPQFNNVIALYNNDSRGRSFFIQQISSDTDGDSNFIMGFAQGFAGHLFPAPFGCFPVNPSWAAVPGQLYYDAGALNPSSVFLFTSSQTQVVSLGFSYDAAICILPPTWSIVIGLADISFELAAQIHYQVLTS